MAGPERLMSQRRVEAVRTNAHGYVTHVVCASEDWSPRAASDVILDIELGEHSYFVLLPNRRSQIIDATDATGRYLRCADDDESTNTLLELPTG